MENEGKNALTHRYYVVLIIVFYLKKNAVTNQRIMSTRRMHK
jgi:hypothetical protein